MKDSEQQNLIQPQPTTAFTSNGAANESRLQAETQHIRDYKQFLRDDLRALRRRADEEFERAMFGRKARQQEKKKKRKEKTAQRRKSRSIFGFVDKIGTPALIAIGVVLLYLLSRRIFPGSQQVLSFPFNISMDQQIGGFTTGQLGLDTHYQVGSKVLDFAGITDTQMYTKMIRFLHKAYTIKKAYEPRYGHKNLHSVTVPQDEINLSRFIVLVVFNDDTSQTKLQQFLTSMSRQKYSNFRVVVVDEGSKQVSRAIRIILREKKLVLDLLVVKSIRQVGALGSLSLFKEYIRDHEYFVFVDLVLQRVGENFLADIVKSHDAGAKCIVMKSRAKQFAISIDPEPIKKLSIEHFIYLQINQGKTSPTDAIKVTPKFYNTSVFSFLRLLNDQECKQQAQLADTIGSEGECEQAEDKFVTAVLRLKLNEGITLPISQQKGKIGEKQVELLSRMKQAYFELKMCRDQIKSSVPL